jgi:O-antigen/teichoic acid export membrane protein
MIKESFFKGFVKRDGIFVLLSTGIDKFSGILISIYIIRFLDKVEYGKIAIALSLVGILASISGMGFNWALLRFGPIVKSQSGKRNLYSFSLKLGTIFTIILAGIVLLYYYLTEKLDIYIFIFLIYLILNFQLDLLKSYYRVINRNKVYSKITTFQSVSLLVFAFLLSFFFDGLGYSLAFIFSTLVPFFAFFKISDISNKKIEINSKSYIKYGLVTGVGMIANQTMVTAGPLLADFYGANAAEVASLKVATIIPFNLLILPFLILTTDFVYLSKHYLDKSVLKEYYFSYLKAILKITALPMVVLIFLNEYIFTLLFSSKYSDGIELNIIMLIAVYISILFRVPLGNILSAVGKSNWNFIHTIFWFIIFIPLSYYLFQYKGIIGIVYSIALIFSCSGFISFFLFAKYLKILK